MMNSIFSSRQFPATRAAGEMRKAYERSFKRAMDVFLSLLILPAILPVLLVLYVGVRMDGGPGFFGHNRIGRNGRVFRCWKVRTMVQDSQERLAHLLATDPEARAEWDRDQKLRNDPRVTPFGAFLRSSSLDELPQIWNVLKGDMSLIGPRPVTEAELQRYGAQKADYLAMRPGITGLWQVMGRNELSYDERVSLDTRYRNELSLPMDLRILAKTVATVVLRTGH